MSDATDAPSEAKEAPAASNTDAAAGDAPAAEQAPRRERRGASRRAGAPADGDAGDAGDKPAEKADKAENIILLDVTGRADYADRLIIATGLVERQLQAMATHLDEALGKAGLNLKRDAIQASPDWVLIDAGDLVIHLFRPEARELYRIERMWGPESPGASDAPAG